jgi:drug/metabolite transporter (DMT)-like permease
MNPPIQSHRTLLVLAFAAIYLVWGSTYLAIRIMVETLPPFSSAGVRFLIAGGSLLVFLLARGSAFPTRNQWHHSLIGGVLLLLGGNGLIVWAEKSIPSGLAALLVALAPIWFALLNWLRPHGVPPTGKTILGIAVGFLGVILLVHGRSGDSRMEGTLTGVIAVIGSGICWAGGSLYSKHAATSGSHWMNAATQMICGGAALGLAGIFLGEPLNTDWSAVSVRSLTALAYLIVFGSWIGFSAYIWLLSITSAARVSTYAYVNPVIAVFLGWAILDERVTSQMISGALVVLAGVIIITRARNA